MHSRDSDIPTVQDMAKVAEGVVVATKDNSEEVMLLKRWNGKLLAESLQLPELEVEIERAVDQVEQGIEAATAVRNADAQQATNSTDKRE